MQGEVFGPYRLDGLIGSGGMGVVYLARDVALDLNKHQAVSGGGVEGRMRLGRFTAGAMAVDLPQRRVVLTGRPRLHIEQGAIR